jgi:hypothetical protein
MVRRVFALVWTRAWRSTRTAATLVIQTKMVRVWLAVKHAKWQRMRRDAATAIQGFARRAAARSDVVARRMRSNCAVRLQARQRGVVARTVAARARLRRAARIEKARLWAERLERARRLRACVSIQSAARGYFARQLVAALRAEMWRQHRLREMRREGGTTVRRLLRECRLRRDMLNMAASQLQRAVRGFVYRHFSHRLQDFVDEEARRHRERVLAARKAALLAAMRDGWWPGDPRLLNRNRKKTFQYSKFVSLDKFEKKAFKTKLAS